MDITKNNNKCKQCDHQFTTINIVSQIIDDINQSNTSSSSLPKDKIIQKWQIKYNRYWVLSIKREYFIKTLIELCAIIDIDIELIHLLHQKLVKKIKMLNLTDSVKCT